MSAYTVINLEQLASPAVIAQPDFETILAALKADMIARIPDLEAVLELESEPATKILEVWAYRETLLRAEVDAAGKGNMLAYAAGESLDQLAAFYGVERAIIQPGDDSVVPPIEEILETDTRLRLRTQLALEGFSTAGPSGAYIFHGLTADPTVKDISAQSSTPGQVDIAVLSSDGDGTPSAGLLTTVEAALNDDDVRPLCDTVVVAAATVIDYTVSAELTLYYGPDSSEVLSAAQEAVEAYVAAHHYLGHDITRSGLFAALHQAGVQNVSLTAPAADIVVDPDEAAHCSAISVTVAGRDV